MTAAKKRQQQSGPDPGSTPHMTEAPPHFRADDHSWMLQTIMGLQQSVGELTGKLDLLIETVGEQSKKVDGLAEKVGEMRGGLNVARWFIGTLIAIGILIGGLLWRLPTIIEALRGG